MKSLPPDNSRRFLMIILAIFVVLWILSKAKVGLEYLDDDLSLTGDIFDNLSEFNFSSFNFSEVDFSFLSQINNNWILLGTLLTIAASFLHDGRIFNIITTTVIIVLTIWYFSGHIENYLKEEKRKIKPSSRNCTLYDHEDNEAVKSLVITHQPTCITFDVEKTSDVTLRIFDNNYEIALKYHPSTIKSNPDFFQRNPINEVLIAQRKEYRLWKQPYRHYDLNRRKLRESNIKMVEVFASVDSGKESTLKASVKKCTVRKYKKLRNCEKVIFTGNATHRRTAKPGMCLLNNPKTVVRKVPIGKNTYIFRSNKSGKITVYFFDLIPGESFMGTTCRRGK